MNSIFIKILSLFKKKFLKFILNFKIFTNKKNKFKNLVKYYIKIF